MPLSKQFVSGPVVTPSGQINQITNRSIDPGIETILHYGDGQVDPSWAGVMFMKPVATFSTTALARALGYSAFSGLSVVTALDFWFQKAAAGGTRLTGANSTKFTATNGILCPTAIEAENTGLATVDYQMACVSSDGSTAPLSVALLQEMPTIVATRELFTVGPVNINGTLLEGVQSIKVDLGMDIAIEGGDGFAFPTFTFINRRTPRITVRLFDIDLPSSLMSGNFYVSQNTTDTLLYFRKLASGGTRVANGTAEHVRLAIDDGIFTVRPIEGGEEKPSMIEIQMEPVFDGTNDTLALSTASAIA